jgi:hypothetical protein
VLAPAGAKVGPTICGVESACSDCSEPVILAMSRASAARTPPPRSVEASLAADIVAAPAPVEAPPEPDVPDEPDAPVEVAAPLEEPDEPELGPPDPARVGLGAPALRVPGPE